MEDIPNKVRDVLGIMVDVNLRRKTGREFLEIVVEPYPYPVSYKGAYHYRSGSTKQELKGAALDKFLLRKQGRHWDGVPMPNVGLSDLDTTVLTAFRRRATRSQRISEEILAESDAVLIDRLHLTEGDYLKRAAVLLFHPDPERFVTGAFVKIGFFENNANVRYHDEIHGDLFTQVNQTMEILHAKYLTARISYEGIQRVETWPVPSDALREAVLNAISHKDYSSSVPIQISVYHDKLMLWNPGQLPPDWTVEQLLQKHASLPFNPDVANAFFRAGMVESWGQGIERIMQTCAAAELPPPELRYEQTGLWIIFSFSSTSKEKTQVETQVETPVETLVETPVKIPDQILNLLKNNPATTLSVVAETVGKSLSSVERISTKLSKQGFLKRVGSTKNGRWQVTDKPIQTLVETKVETPVKTLDQILELLKNNPTMPLSEVAETIGKSLSAVERASAKLKKQGCLKRVGSTKSGHWLVSEKHDD